MAINLPCSTANCEIPDPTTLNFNWPVPHCSEGDMLIHDESLGLASCVGLIQPEGEYKIYIYFSFSIVCTLKRSKTIQAK